MTPMTPTAVALAADTIPTITVTPQAASNAYQAAGLAGAEAGAEDGIAASGFGATLHRAMQGAIQTGKEADRQTMKAIAGGGNVTDVVTAVSKAELTLQATMAIRDKMVSAYQDILRMPI